MKLHLLTPLTTSLLFVACAGVDDNSLLDARSKPNNECEMLYIDFPCYKYQECSGARSFMKSKDLTCSDLGYDPRCCSGLQCGSDGGDNCAADELCVPSGSDFTNDTCRKFECGATDDRPCNEGSFCEFATGSCGKPGDRGVCLLTDSVVWGPDIDWQCGCDGIAYQGASARRAAGISLKHEGRCPEASLTPFDR
jgi:hypothetical protein